jgi:hypothetical protein
MQLEKSPPPPFESSPFLTLFLSLPQSPYFRSYIKDFLHHKREVREGAEQLFTQLEALAQAINIFSYPLFFLFE